MKRNKVIGLTGGISSGKSLVTAYLEEKDLVESGSVAVAREKGLIRSEGKDYVVEDGVTWK